MNIDVSAIKDKLLLVTASGKTLDVTPAIVSMSREDPQGELAQRINVTMANVAYGSGTIKSAFSMASRVFLFSNCGKGTQELFRGVTWDWTDSDGSDDTVTLILYDRLIYTQKSKGDRYYSKGMSTKAIITDICGSWGIPLVYTYGSVTHAKQVFSDSAISSMFTTVLDDAQSKLDDDYVIRDIKGTMHVDKVGGNDEIVVIEGGKNAVTTQSHITMDDLITKVVIMGKEDSKGRRAVHATLLGKTEYGVLQDIVNRDSDTSLASATATGKKMLKQNGTPAKDQTITASDAPMLRKGDKFYVRAGSMNGYYIVTSITHDHDTHTMTVQSKEAS